jgi:hypothetical protein
MQNLTDEMYEKDFIQQEEGFCRRYPIHPLIESLAVGFLQHDTK